jgi:hypothetical protein
MFYLRSEERVTRRPLPEFTSRGYNFFSSRQFRDAHRKRNAALRHPTPATRLIQ